MASDRELSTDDAFDLLAAEPRQIVLSHLFGANRSATVEALVQAVAEQTTGQSCDELPDFALEEVHLRLYHHHLPMLEDYGTISWDIVTGDVALTERADTLERYLPSSTASQQGTATAGF